MIITPIFNLLHLLINKLVIIVFPSSDNYDNVVFQVDFHQQEQMKNQDLMVTAQHCFHYTKFANKKKFWQTLLIYKIWSLPKNYTYKFMILSTSSYCNQSNPQYQILIYNPYMKGDCVFHNKSMNSTVCINLLKTVTLTTNRV